MALPFALRSDTNINIKTLSLFLSAFFLLTSHFAFAGNAAWGTSPSSGDWNAAINWIPHTVPNGPSDIATFGASSVTDLSINTTAVTVDGIVFNSGAPGFDITLDSSSGIVNLFLTGTGIVNNSGVVQSLNGGGQSAIYLSDNATAGNLTSLRADGGGFVFYDSASAGSANVIVNSVGIYQSYSDFWQSTTAADATITGSNFAQINFNDTATAANAVLTVTTGAFAIFGSNSTAENAIATCIGGNGIYGSNIDFQQSATAGQAHFGAEGATTSGEGGSFIQFNDSTTAANGTFVINGGTGQDIAGAVLNFFGNSKAGNAIITANAGANGGEGGAIIFDGNSRGSTASISLLGNAQLDIGSHTAPGVTIGSLEGNGLVLLGSNALTVGTNNLSTTFSGVIQESGSLAKIGSGTLTLSEASTYTGPTTLSAGVLQVSNRSGSGTGTGAVKANAGTLGGKGTIAGSVTIGTGGGGGAFLAPSIATNTLARLIVQSLLTFKADGTYSYKLNAKRATADQVIANGVTIETGAQFNFVPVANKRLTAGTVFTAISNASANPIAGTFANLPDDSSFTAGRNTYQVNYHGGDGNDLTLTVVPQQDGVR